MMEIRIRSLRIALLVLLAFGCGKNVGTLISQRECVAGEPGCPPIVEECTDTSMIRCGVGSCVRMVPACVDGLPSICVPGEPSDELCNDRDDDCDGESDEGCDDDHDGYCDAALAVIGQPKVCPLGTPYVLDCDDLSGARNPGQPEVCEDSIDNDCNGLSDYLDVNRCTPVTAAFQDADGLIALNHGATQLLRANVTPPSAELAREWTVTSALPAMTCSAEDVSITEPDEQPGATIRRIGIVDDPAKLPCKYELTLYVGGLVADRATLSMRNTRPRVEKVAGATRNGDVLVMRVAAGTNPRLAAELPMDADEPVVIEWVGTDVGLLDCGTPCLGPTMQFKQPLPAGTYRLRIRARDSFDLQNRLRDLTIEAVECVWARVNGTGFGGAPAVGNAFGTIQAAVNAAVNRAPADVCIAAAGTFNLAASLTLPTGVGINAAFDGAGMPSDNRAALVFAESAHLGFAAGYTGAVRRMRIFGGGARPLIDVMDASPTLVGLELTVSPLPGSRAVKLETTGNTPATVRVMSSQVKATAPLTDATGIEIAGGAGSLATLIWNGASTIDMLDCSGDCRGIAILGNAKGTLTGERIDVEAVGAGSRATGVEIAGDAARTATGEVRGMRLLIARTLAEQPADQTVAIRLSRTEGVHILTNDAIGPIAFNSGRRFSAGIADGEIRRDGTFDRGASHNLTIDGNRQIVAGRSDYAWTLATCEDLPAAREGTDIGAGVVLVGTSSVALRKNGNTGSRDNGIFGSASSAVWDPSERAIPPSVPGVWTVDTFDVRIDHNEIRSGVLSTPLGCPPPQLPYVVALRDGLGPNVSPSFASAELRLDANGVVTGRRASFDAVPSLERTGAHLIEIGGGMGTSAELVNNYLAVTRGTDLVGLYAYGTSDVALWNNVVEVEAISSTVAAVVKRAVVLDRANPASLDLVNNIVVVWQNPADAPSSIAIALDQCPDGIGKLRHNLFFVEAAERASAGGYVDQGGVMFTRGTFEEYASQTDAAGNLLAPPLFQSRRLEHWRSLTHLSDRSPARDAGQREGAPAVDRFGQPRPQGAGVDIGHEEHTF